VTLGGEDGGFKTIREDDEVAVVHRRSFRGGCRHDEESAW